MEMVVSQIAEELVPIMGVGLNRRRFGQLEDGDEYLEQVGLQCEDWWSQQGVPREVLHATDQELGPIADWFDQEERDPTSQILSKSDNGDSGEEEVIRDTIEESDEDQVQDHQSSSGRPQKKMLELQRQRLNYWISATPESHMKHYNSSGNTDTPGYTERIIGCLVYIGTPAPLI
jgi:hypothetical protein